MSGHSRALIAMLTLVGAAGVGGTALAQTTPPPAPKVFHACYVPLTGTVYRVGETGIHATCTSDTHVPFSWTDGDGAVRPVGASAGDMLQFDGTQWKPAKPQILGGLAGYEVVSRTISNTYGAPSLEMASGSYVYQKGGCATLAENIPPFCNYTFRYQTTAAAVTTTITCTVGKKALGVFGPTSIAYDVLADGSVTATIPTATRYSRTQNYLMYESYVEANPTNYLYNQLPGEPSTVPDSYALKLVCANAS